MKSFTNINPVFSESIMIVEPTDPVHSDNANASVKQLLANTQVNRDTIEQLKTSTGNTEDSKYNANGVYKVGDYCIYNNELYKCIVSIDEPEEWNKDHWEKTTITEELLDLNNKEVEVVDPMTATEEGFAADAKLTGDALRELSVKMHPIGSIYMSLESTDPALLFGGTWEQIQGRFLLATSDEYEVGSIGGEATHKLTVAEMPSHSHSFSYSHPLQSASGGSNMWAPRDITYTNTNVSGSDLPHNNMPPYLAVYMWQRVG